MVLGTIAMLFGSFSYVQAETDIQKLSKVLPADVFKEVSKIPPKPHFLLGLEPKTDEWEQYLEWRKIFQTKDLFYGYNGSGVMDKSRADYVAPGNTELSETVNVSGKNILILYTHHHFTKDGMHSFWSVTGEKNLAEFSPVYRKYEIQWGLGHLSDEQWKNIQRVLGWAQFEAMKELVHDVIGWALKKNLKDYSEMNLTEGVLEARAVLLDDPDYKKRLDDPVPGTAGLKVRDIIPVPLTRAEDFLPDLLIVGPRGFYGGFANWKTPDMERIVFFDLLGLALWHVSGWPMPAHEFVHTNPYLQGIPLSFYYDIEMWADLTTGLESGMREFLFHPYMAVVRDSVRTQFGYDYEEAKRRIMPGQFGVKDIREKEFREHARRVKVIRDELVRFVKDPKKGLLVRFYSDPYYWVAINTKYCDTAAAWRILFALSYEPAGLYDPDKKDKDGKIVSAVQQTKEWLTREEDGGNIRRLAEKAMANTGKESKFAKELSKVESNELMKCPVDSRWFLMNEAEKRMFHDFIKPLLLQGKDGDPDARVLLMRIFGPAILQRLQIR